MRFIASILLVVLALAAPAVQAAEPSHPAPAKGDPAVARAIERLTHYVKSKVYLQSVARVVLGGEHQITPSCKTPKILGRVGFIVLGLPRFKAGTDYPVSGAWKDQIRVDRCGPKVTHNVLVQARADGPPRLGLLLPGNTGASIGMQEQGAIVVDAVKAAMKGADCRDDASVIVADTEPQRMLKQVKTDKQGRILSGEWREIWTFHACGKIQPVAVVFSVTDGHIGYKVAPVMKKRK
jgi:hypothetical protein